MTVYVADFEAYEAAGNTGNAPRWYKVFTTKVAMLAAFKAEAEKWVGPGTMHVEEHNGTSRGCDGHASFIHAKYKKYVNEHVRHAQMFWYEREVES